MDTIKQFYDLIAKEMAVTLATAGQEGVTMRVVSPVKYGKEILIFTAANSTKYRQLQACPNCCIGVQNFFAQCTARFGGATMLPQNSQLREVYSEKFPDAFAENVQFGGRDAEFILLSPYRLSGWVYSEKDTSETMSMLPFEVQL